MHAHIAVLQAIHPTPAPSPRKGAAKYRIVKYEPYPEPYRSVPTRGVGTDLGIVPGITDKTLRKSIQFRTDSLLLESYPVADW
jgi:hypothetical protein